MTRAPEPRLGADAHPEPASPQSGRLAEAARRSVRTAWNAPLFSRMVVAVFIAVPAVVLRTWRLDALGFNSDEAVYAGQAASIAGNLRYLPYFPVFRAHPLLFQTLLSLPYQAGVSPLVGRLFAASFGLGTVALTYLVGQRLYGRRAGAAGALLMAVMPYHVVVSRQVLLDGPTTFFATLTLYLLVRYAELGSIVPNRALWLYAAGGAMGLTFLSKETSVLLVAGAYAFFALAPQVQARLRDLAVTAGLFVAVVSVYPITLMLAGHQGTGQSFLVWQLFRQANHAWTFYPVVVPPVIGWLVLICAGAGVWLLRRQRTWRETLLLCWIVVPSAFFQLWPVKGFQYLLPMASPVALLAARALAAMSRRRVQIPRSALRGPSVSTAAIAVVALSLALPAWRQVQPDHANTSFLAGSGGVPGGREAGLWLDEHAPKGARILALGPSMANILQFYGDRKAYGLSVSPNPLNRNPVYEPVPNPDFLLRNSEVQYLVWDSFSASRSSFFSEKLLRYADRYSGQVVHTETIEVPTADGSVLSRPIIVIYEVRA